MNKITTFNEFQKEAVSMKISLDKFKEKYPDLNEEIMLLMAVAYNGLGLGEAGEVQGKIKKIIRDNGGVITLEAKAGIMMELGDTLYYIADMCEVLGTTLEDVANMNIQKLKSRHARGVINGSGDNR